MPRLLARALWPFALLLCVIAPRPASAALLCDDPVMTASGAVRGVADEDHATCSWKGIPYAAPPVDDLRWRPPEPPEPWAGIRDGSAFGARCLQKSVMELVNFDPSHEASEDCLFLNVWRPRTPGPHPVMVFYHGGGLFGGTGNTPFYDGARLAELGDVVVVTLNYRLAVFGYLSTPGLRAEDPHGSAGNYGLLDQIEALRWVQTNIAAFGGDPEEVTIFGESAGGWSVCTLLASPVATGLFHKAIMESGGCAAVTTAARGDEVGERVADALGCDADDVACMRAASGRKVLRRGVEFELKGFEWLPRIDGWAVPGRPSDLIVAGEYNQVPFLAGANRDEVKVAVAFHPANYLDGAARYPERLTDKFGVTASEALVELYALDGYGRPANAYRTLLTDAALLCPTFDGLMEVAQEEPQTWLYRFDYDDFNFGRLIGAAHGMEVAFVFGNLDKLPIRFLYPPGRRHRGDALAQAMMGYWAAFAHDGDPNAPGLPPWPSFAQTGQLQLLDGDITSQPLSEELVSRCAFWSELARTQPWIVETMGLSSGRPGRTRVVSPPPQALLSVPPQP